MDILPVTCEIIGSYLLGIGRKKQVIISIGFKKNTYCAFLLLI